MGKMIKLSKSDIGFLEIFSVIKTLRKSYLGMGDEVQKFENNFKKLISSKYCTGVGSGTDAIFLALKV